MFKAKRLMSGVLLAAAVLLAAMFSASAASAATCTGEWIDYYESPAFLEIVGTRIVCPGFPDQIDTDANGNLVVTPYFTIEEAVCPCGGGDGNGDDDDDNGEGGGTENP